MEELRHLHETNALLRSLTDNTWGDNGIPTWRLQIPYVDRFRNMHQAISRGVTWLQNFSRIEYERTITEREVYQQVLVYHIAMERTARSPQEMEWKRIAEQILRYWILSYKRMLARVLQAARMMNQVVQMSHAVLQDRNHLLRTWSGEDEFQISLPWVQPMSGVLRIEPGLTAFRLYLVAVPHREGQGLDLHYLGMMTPFMRGELQHKDLEQAEKGSSSSLGNMVSQGPLSHAEHSNLLIWNSRGVGNPEFIQSIRLIAHDYNLLAAIVVDTRRTKEQSLPILAELGFAHSHIVDSQGFSGGIWLLWNDENIKVTPGTFTLYSMSALFEIRRKPGKWRQSMLVPKSHEEKSVTGL